MFDPEQEGARRTAIHAGQASQRILCEGHDKIGAAGEQQFSRDFGLPMREITGSGGDNGYDFICGGFKIDVKATWKKLNLLVPAESRPLRAHIYVLGWYQDNMPIEWLGWATRPELLRTVPKDFGHGFKSYHIWYTQLHSMEQFKLLLAELKKD